MKRLIPVFFAVVAIVLAFFFFSKNLFVEESAVRRSRLVVPVSDGSSADFSDAVPPSSFLSLSGEETLISTVEADIDDDGFEDQINVIKNASESNLQVVVALYTPSASNYVRSYTIQTEISQVRTFVCTCLDVIGNHRNALVYQGINESGKFVMRIFSAEKSGSAFAMDEIGRFESDGTVFIQQNQRGEAYDMEQSAGESFPVWVYSSEGEGDGGGGSRLDQVQTMYDWSPSEKKYVEVRSIRVPGSSIAAKELSRVQDGTVSSFVRFLDGLWYKDDGSDAERRRFIFFDSLNEEVVFQFGDSEEVYSWLKSNLRRNGIYFSAVNKPIETLQRNFDISLVTLDEIRVRVTDDVRMLIGEENLWDGSYRKLFVQKKQTNREGVSEFIEKFIKEENWQTPDGIRVDFSGSTYSVSGGSVSDRGRFTQIDMFGKTFIQFRSETGTRFFSGEYLPTSVEADGGEAVVLQKYSVNPEGFYQDPSGPVRLTKFVEKAEEPVVVVQEPEIDEQEDFQVQESKSQVVLADKTKKDLPVPKASLRISPRYFSPDGDGSGDELNVLLNVESEAKIRKWSFVVKSQDGKREFWSKSGTEKVDERIVWDGRSAKGEIVQSATDYPYVFTLEDVNGTKCVEEGFIQVDILVMEESGRLKIQVPSIIFRSDNADFKSDAEVKADPNWDRESYGLDQRTIDNNVRVLGRVAEILKKFQDYNVRIEGNANNMSGTASEEAEVTELSEERAKFVMKWLVDEGIAASRLSAKGNGSKYALAKAWDAENRWKNRRVDFILIK